MRSRIQPEERSQDKMQYSTKRFRIFSGKDREGFVFFHNFEIPQLILEDILFQLFRPFYPNILCPQIYYFSDSEVMLNYQQLKLINSFIYVHFMERAIMYKKENKIQIPFEICDLNQLAHGTGINGNRLFIMSEKQYLVYQNKKYCGIVKARIDDLNKHHERTVIATRSMNSLLRELNKRAEEQEQDLQIEGLNSEIKRTTDQVLRLDETMQRLRAAEEIVNEALRLTGIRLKGLDDL